MTEIEEHLLELERELLNADVPPSAEALSLLVADEFVEFGSSGRVWSRQEAIQALRTESELQLAISDFRVTVLADSVALVTYRAVRHGRPYQSETASLRSSLWVLRDGRWQILFHQGTIIPPEPPADPGAEGRRDAS